MKLGRGHIDHVSPDARTHFPIPAGGFLEAIELRPHGDGPDGTLPNMDARAITELAVALMQCGQAVPLTVLVRWREPDEAVVPL